MTAGIVSALLPASPYQSSFFARTKPASTHGAASILPQVLAHTRPGSVVDVGCGIGAWARAALDAGIPDVLGIDGAYVPRDSLVIPEECFEEHDLNEPLKLGRRFDLAICLEVAEHLRTDRGAPLVQELTRLAPLVLFSAAIPHQGGVDHINEQWQSHWVGQFSRCGYVAYDLVRPEIWDSDVSVPYAQNMLLYADPTQLEALDLGNGTAPGMTDVVHPRLYLAQYDEPPLQYLLRKLPAAALRSVVWRLDRERLLNSLQRYRRKSR